MRFSSFFLPVAFATAVGGCATWQSAPAPSAAQLLNDDPSSECLTVVNRDPRLAILVPKIGSLTSAGHASVAMLTSKDVPTPDEKKALELWGNERQRCLELGSGYRVQYLPASVVSSFEIGQRDLVVLTAKLYSAQLNFGQFNVQRQELATSHRQKYVEFAQDISNGGGGYGASLNSRMPVQTNCNRYGDVSWNCTIQ